MAEEFSIEPKKPIKKYIILSSIIALLIIIILIFTLIPKEEPELELKDLTEAELAKFIEEQVAICVKENQDYRCLAYATNNEKYCGKIENINKRNECFAEITKDSKYCQEIESEDKKNRCFAKVMNNPSYCEKIQDSSKKYNCLTLLTQDISYCENLKDDTDRYICYASIDDPDNCNNIPDLDYKNNCLAEINLDSSYCDPITDIKLREDCLEITTDKEGCLKLPTINCYDEVYVMVASLREDFSYCDKVQYPVNQIDCQAQLQYHFLDKGMNTMNITACNKIEDPDAKNACISVVNKDLEMCKSVEKDEIKFFCILQFIEFLHQPELCNELTELEPLNDCNEYFAAYLTEAE